MRVGRIAVDEQTEFAVEVAPDSWAPLSSVGLDYPDLPSLIADFDSVTGKMAQGGLSGIPSSELTMKCPIVRPSKILAIGLNYADHARETGATPPERPVVFAKYPNSLNDPFGAVEIGGDITQQADYEAELAVVIGRRVRRVSDDDACAYIFGYAVADDVSARDWQRADAQFSRSKSADTFCPIGPWITTAEDVADPTRLRISSRVNGEVRQDSTTAQMIFAIPRLISFLSSTITLEPGDVILTGTPPGVGLGFKPPRFLVPGDIVECEVEGLGRIRNVFVDV